MKSHAIRSIAVAALTMIALTPAAQAATSEWKPERNVEFNVGSGAGSGSDRLARTIQGVWQNRDLVRPSSTVVNKTAALAMSHIHQQAGNPHYLLLVSSTLLSNHVTGTSPYKYSEFTPMAILGEEPIILVVRTDSPIKSGKDLVEQFRKDVRGISIGIASALGNHNHIAVAQVAKAAGADIRNLKLVVFDSSSKGMIALLGGHVDLYATSVDSAVPHIQAGKARAIGIGAEKRLRDEMGNVPTWREQGVNVLMSDIRVVVAPGKLTEPQVAYWDDVMAKTVQSEEWKKFDAAGYSVPFYLNSREATKYLDGRYSLYRTILGELGLVKQ